MIPTIAHKPLSRAERLAAPPLTDDETKTLRAAELCGLRYAKAVLFVRQTTEDEDDGRGDDAFHSIVAVDASGERTTLRAKVATVSRVFRALERSKMFEVDKEWVSITCNVLFDKNETTMMLSRAVPIHDKVDMSGQAWGFMQAFIAGRRGPAEEPRMLDISIKAYDTERHAHAVWVTVADFVTLSRGGRVDDTLTNQLWKAVCVEGADAA